MNEILNFFTDTSNETVIVVCLCLSVFRIYLEVIGFDFQKLPMTNKLDKNVQGFDGNRFHRVGLFLSIGYIVLFAPGFLFS